MDLDSHRSGTMVVEALMSTIENISVIETTAVVVVYDTKGKMLGTQLKAIPIHQSLEFSEWKLESDWRKLHYDIAQSLAITNLQ